MLASVQEKGTLPRGFKCSCSSSARQAVVQLAEWILGPKGDGVRKPVIRELVKLLDVAVAGILQGNKASIPTHSWPLCLKGPKKRTSCVLNTAAVPCMQAALQAL